MQELSMTQVVSAVILGSVVLMGSKLRRIESPGHQPTKVTDLYTQCTVRIFIDYING